jgi:hypothetical protein
VNQSSNSSVANNQTNSSLVVNNQTNSSLIVNNQTNSSLIVNNQTNSSLIVNNQTNASSNSSIPIIPIVNTTAGNQTDISTAADDKGSFPVGAVIGVIAGLGNSLNI